MKNNAALLIDSFHFCYSVIVSKDYFLSGKKKKNKRNIVHMFQNINHSENDSYKSGKMFTR